MEPIPPKCIPSFNPADYQPFDAYSRKLVDLNKKWVTKARYVFPAANVIEIAPFNPFRTSLIIHNESVGTLTFVGPDSLDVLTTCGLSLFGDYNYLEYCLDCHGPIVTSRWLAGSAGFPVMVVIESIYRGNPESRP